MRNRAFMAIWLMFALIAYVLPWLVNTSAGLTVGAYDLAEWVSLHPAARAGNPPLLASLLLRLHLPLFVLLLTQSVGKRGSWQWWMQIIVFLALVIAQLPPFEFIQQRNDGNYQQQAALALLSLGIGLSGFIGLWERGKERLTLTIAIIGIGLALWGCGSALELMQQFRLTPQIGLGMIGLVGLYSALGLDSLRHIYQQTRQPHNRATAFRARL